MRGRTHGHAIWGTAAFHRWPGGKQTSELHSEFVGIALSSPP